MKGGGEPPKPKRNGAIRVHREGRSRPRAARRSTHHKIKNANSGRKRCTSGSVDGTNEVKKRRRESKNRREQTRAAGADKWAT